MPLYQTVLEIGNLVVLSGESTLLDMYDSTVAPAFFDTTQKRVYNETKYLFYQPRLVVLDDNENEIGIAGKLVKDTVLEREQILEDDQLKEASGHLASSPSSIFLLILSNHRLLYFREHKGSPSMDVFRSTFAQFLKAKHRAFIDAKSLVIDPSTGKKPSKKSLVQKYPYPTVDLRPIASDSSIVAFLKKFKTLESVSAQILPTNSEIDNEKLFGSIRSAQQRIKSKKTTLRYENKEGLNKSETSEQIGALVKQGNHDVTLSGQDHSGGKLIGNNEHFKVKVPIKEVPFSINHAAQLLFQSFKNLITNEIISVPAPKADARRKVKAIAEAGRK